MNYQTFKPHAHLKALVKCYWTLEVPAGIDAPKQRIVPDGCIEMAFILGDDVKRYTSEEDFIIQPRSMVIGQITGPFYIQPSGYVNTFAVRFYPFGFANFVAVPLSSLSDKETPIKQLFGEQVSKGLELKIVAAKDTRERVNIIEGFLLDAMQQETTSSKIVRNTIETLAQNSGNGAIGSMFNNDPSKRRQLERVFLKQVGMSPKQLGKVMRLQAALNMMLNHASERFSHVAYENDYYDQAHFIRDFKALTGITPTEFADDPNMALSSRIYKKD